VNLHIFIISKTTKNVESNTAEDHWYQSFGVQIKLSQRLSKTQSFVNQTAMI